MTMRSLQPQFSRHLIGFSHVDFGSLVQTLYGIEEGISRRLWLDSSPSSLKGKKPSIGQRSRDVNTISATRPRPPRYYQTVGQTFDVYYLPSPQVQYRPPVPFRPMSPTYLHSTLQPIYATQATHRSPAHYPQPRAPPTQRPIRQFSMLGMPLSRAFKKLVERRLLTALALRPPPQPLPP